MAVGLASSSELPAYRAGEPALLVAAAEGAVRSYCHWHIAPKRVDVEVVVDGSGGCIQPLPTMHLTDVTAITEVGESVDLSTVQWSQAGYLWRPTPWTSDLRGVTATITHGFDPVPPEVNAVVLDLVELMVGARGGVTRRQVGSVSVSIAAQTMTDLHKMVLDRYRIPAAP